MPEEREISTEDAGHLLYLQQKQEGCAKRMQLVQAQLEELQKEEAVLLQERQDAIDKIGMKPGDALVQRDEKFLLVSDHE
jgi:hypothetical protein